MFTIPDKAKPGQDNGLLQAWEIFEKMRIDADLVTLSACDSGLGKEMGGEGLIGLTRAFQYAGARTVLASLWKVEDESTAELMKRFYGYLKAGKTKDEALRLAQIDLIRSPSTLSPGTGPRSSSRATGSRPLATTGKQGSIGRMNSGMSVPAALKFTYEDYALLPEDRRYGGGWRTCS